MDLGPVNVLGERTPLTDPLVDELVHRIESAMMSADDRMSLEIEGRLGKLCLPSGKVRVPLPVASEIVLAPSGSCASENGKLYKYEFVPNLERETFDGVKNRLEKLMELSKSTAPQKFPIIKVANVTSSHTIDEIYKSPTPARLSFEYGSYGTSDSVPIEIISKEPIEKMDVWSGNYPEIDDEATADEANQSGYFPLDYRLSINRERKVDNMVDFFSQINRADCVMKREKKRAKFDMKAWVVDLTEVNVIGGDNVSGATSSLEIEVELKTELLFQQLDRKRENKNHAAFTIIDDFITFLRDLCFVFGGAQKEQKGGKYPDLGGCEPSEDKKRKYKEIAGTNVLPIIGDYIFHILPELKSK
jgi:hypothetical protein